MKTEGKTFSASVLLHLALVGGAAYFSTFPPKPQEPILIDFTMAQEPPAKKREMQGDSGAPSTHATPSLPSPQKIVPTSTMVPEMPSIPVKPANEVIASPPSYTGTSVPVPVAVPTIGGAMAQPGPGKTGNGSQNTSSSAGEKSTGMGTGSHGDSVESKQTRYLNEHFAYIRNAIAGNQQYPVKARKMGWTGKLAIEFVILESGAVDMIRITKSSGIPLLDKDAVDTVRRSGPFPKPPVSARLVIPLEYVLE